MLKYKMGDIIPLLSIPQPPRGRSSYNIPCPNCDSARTKPRDWHCNISLEKNVYCCPKCGQFQGGVFDLYAYYMGVPRDQVEGILNGDGGASGQSGKQSGKKAGKKAKHAPEPPAIPQAALADVTVRDRTYRALLAKLALASDHRENLLGRGLTDEAIAQFGYRTTPVVGFHALAKELVDEGFQLFGVPGFYKNKEDRWTINFNRRGIMIPCRDRLGRIQRIHIRLDHEKRNKFRPLSSGGKFNGCATENWCHLVGPVRENILLIEGYMKADIVHHFTGQTVLAIPGVTSLTQLVDVLLELIGLGVRHVMTCFDMDYLMNWHVEGAYINLINLLGCLDLTFGTYLWVPDYNGLDDYIWEFCLDQGQIF